MGAASKADIEQWWEESDKDECSHLLVVCDTFSHDDYPVRVKKTESIQERVAHYNGPNMQRVMEVYNFSKTLDEQLNRAGALARVWEV